jgi:hypothetical protein
MFSRFAAGESGTVQDAPTKPGEFLELGAFLKLGAWNLGLSPVRQG